MSRQHLTEDEIFRFAYELPSPDARITYLKQVCRDSVEVERIIDLLKEGSPDESFLEKGPVGLVETADIPVPMDTCPGSRLDLTNSCNRSAKGVSASFTWRNKCHRFAEKSLLKVIKPGMDTKQVVARFEAERQALALMDHPNVARVFDGGTTEAGRPYFVMELVKGVPITTFCDENKLDVHQRLDLFCTVCKSDSARSSKGCDPPRYQTV